MSFLQNRFIALIIDTTKGAAQATAEVSATAGEPPPGSWTDAVPTIVLWVGMIAALYFFLIRPQRKRDKQQAEMVQAIKVGDKVLTTSGFYGKIVDIGTDAFMVEFGDNRGIRVPVRKSDVAGLKAPDMSPPNRESKEIEEKKEEKK